MNLNKLLFFAICIIFGLFFATCLDNYHTGETCSVSADCGLGYTCFNNQCVYGSPPCYDLDEGINTNVISSTYSEYLVCNDDCFDNKEIEYYCELLEIKNTTYNCPVNYSCGEDSCINYYCFDTDGPVDVFKKNHIGLEDGGKVYDYCQSTEIVAEAVCGEDKHYHKNYYCPTNYVCEDGICIHSSLATPPPEPEPVKCGEYIAGDYWDLDGCNTCLCKEDGKTLCTDYYCGEPKCSSDEDCEDNKYCLNYVCASVEEEECGYISNHGWHYYECCENSDCSTNKECINNICEEKEQEEQEESWVSNVIAYSLIGFSLLVLLILIYFLLFKH